MIKQQQSHVGNILCSLIIATSCFALVACSGDDSKGEELVQVRPTKPPKINSATSLSGPLVKAGELSVAQFIKNGIYSATQERAIYLRNEVTAPTTTVDNASANFSTTNTQEVGVDEADRVKYDGDILYLATFPDWFKGSEHRSMVRVLERQSDFSLAEVAALNVDDENANINGIYEYAQNLVVLSNNQQMYRLETFAPEPWHPAENTLSLDIYDTSVPTSPLVKTKLKIDGTMLSSRRIGQQLYIVTGYTAYVDGLNQNAVTDQELLTNYLAILDTSAADLMPKIYVDGGKGQPLNSPADCAIPEQATANDGYAHLLTVTRVNLSDATDISATCISAVAELMYMSKDNIYITASVDNQTVLHKVSLDNELTYQATGTVDGIIGWRGAPNLRLSEQDNILRIVASDYAGKEPIHRLFILEQQANKLSTLSTLPNDAHPEAIGKPGEDIYAVRFFGDRAYIVTFERMDPLYVLDLANPLDPKILGALDIPGFSSYLHPLENGYLLGIGQQINIDNIPDNGTQPTEPVTQDGMKVSLFDVSDPSRPFEVNSIVKFNSYTPIEYDYRALSVLNNQGNYQLSMPVESWQKWDAEDQSTWGAHNSLLLLEVDTSAEKPELILRSEVNINRDDDSYIYSGEDRSIIHDDKVYYIHGNNVWRTTWAEDADIFGPY